MTELPPERISEAVSRALSEVRRETQSQEAAVFGVADLQARAVELNRVGGELAWTISYSTAAASIERGTAVERLSLPTVGGQLAWTISYSTAAASVEQGGTPQ